MDTKQLMEHLGIKRTHLIYLRDSMGVKYTTKIVNGKAKCFYSEKAVGMLWAKVKK
jgi:hypothetical protein